MFYYVFCFNWKAKLSGNLIEWKHRHNLYTFEVIIWLEEDKVLQLEIHTQSDLKVYFGDSAVEEASLYLLRFLNKNQLINDLLTTDNI